MYYVRSSVEVAADLIVYTYWESHMISKYCIFFKYTTSAMLVTADRKIKGHITF